MQSAMTNVVRGLAALATALALPPAAWAHGDLTVTSWGGAYTRSQMLAYVIPYEQQTGLTINMERYNGELADVRAQVEAYNVKWDVVDLELGDAIRGCEEGLLEKIDHSTLPPAPDGTPAAEDFLDGMLPECAVGQVIWSTVVAFDPAQFSDNAPATLADFFDTSQYPGKRGLRRSPKVNLEWALLADGVPADQVYDALSTEQGLQRAFAKLDSIKQDIVWWEAGDAPARLLDNEQVAMTSAFNGRIYAANERRERDFGVIWDGQAWDYDMWAIPKRTPKTASLDAAMAFIEFAVASEQIAEQAKYISYGPARRSSMALLDEAVKPHLPTAPENAASALRVDARWWADNQSRLERAFEHWIALKEPFETWRVR